MSTIAPGLGDPFPKLLLVNPGADAGTRLLTTLHRLGIAARPDGRDASGQKLFGARIVDDPAPEWPRLQPFVRSIVAHGTDGWSAVLRLLASEDPGFRPDATVTTTGPRPVTVRACLPLDDPGLTDAALTATLAAAQRDGGLSWGCGGRG